MICVCAWCQRVRTVKGVWKLPETPAQATSKITLTHGICPVCVKKCWPLNIWQNLRDDFQGRTVIKDDDIVIPKYDKIIGGLYDRRI